MVFTGIRAHASGVRPLVIFKSPFMVLHSWHANNCFSVSQALQREFLSIKFFLNNDSRMRFQDFLAVFQGLFFSLEMVSLHLNSFSCSQPIGLNDNAVKLLQNIF